MKITFYGGAKMVTGANYLLEEGDTRILIDCGLHQGSNFCERHNWEQFSYDPTSIKAVFVTHAHIDHTGRLPKLVRDGFRGTVYSTAPTKDAGLLLLADSDHILADEAERFKQPPLYTSEDLAVLERLWRGVEYHAPVTVGPFTITFFNAAHILGSSFISIQAGGKTILFSGDLGNSPAPLIGNRESFTGNPTYALIESAYGDRVHEDLGERRELLEHSIEDAIHRGGTLMIPAFAMERTQELLYEINDLIEGGRIPRVPVYLDSPLAIALTDVYRKYDKYLTHPVGRKASMDAAHLFRFPWLRMTRTTEQSKSINDAPSPKIIIAGAGMLHGGRILHHAKRYLPDPKNTLLIIGYQAAGSLGRQILDGSKAVRHGAPPITVRIHHEDVTVRAHVKAIGGYSAHADQPQLIEWIRPMRGSLKKLFVVQGEEASSKAFARKVIDELAIAASVPDTGESVVL